jgi:predicted RND superfamily exporter protein
MSKVYLYFIKRKIFLISILFLFIASFFFISLRIDGSIDKFLIKNDPERVVYNKFIKLFGSDNIEVISITDNNIFTYKKLYLIRNIISELKKINGVIEVDSLFNQKNFKNKNNMLYTDVFIDPDNIPKDKKILSQIKLDALGNPLVNSIFISKDGKTVFLNVRLKNDRSSEFSKQVITSIQKTLNKYKNNFQKLDQFGYAYIETRIIHYIKKDFTFTIPLAILIIIVVLFFNLKNITLTLIPIITAFLSIVITFGIMGIIGIKLTILTALVPVLIILIGSTEDSHIIHEYLYEVQENNNKKRKYIIYLINKKTLLAIILTSITTIIGFFSIYFNDIVMLKEFALVSSIGLFINFLITLIVIPNYLYYLNVNKIQNMRKKPYTYSKFLNYVEKFFHKGEKSVFFFIFVIVSLFLYFVPKIVIDNNTLKYFKSNSEVIKKVNFFKQNMYGVKTFYIVLETNKKDAFKTYKYLHQLEIIKNYIKKSSFNFSISLADYIGYVNSVIQNNKNLFKVPKNRYLIEQYLLFFHRKDLKYYVTSDFSKANIVVWHNVFSTNKFNLEVNRLKQFIKDNIDPNIKVHIIGQNILISKAANTIAKGELNSIFVTISVVFLLILFIFRSFKIAFIGVLVNLLPIMVTFIIISLLDIKLNMITAMVAAISFGIIVDDTIHILLKFRFEFLNIKNKNIAIINAIKKEGRAVILTSLFLSIGFLVLLTSKFVPVQEYAFLTICVILVALMTDLFVLPVLLRFVKEEG